MTPYRLMFTLILTSLILLLTTGCQSEPDDAQPDTLVISGQGEARAVPDIFRVHATSSRLGEDIETMQQEVNAEMRGALELAQALGIADEQVHATRVTIRPEWEYHPTRKLAGHRVSREIQFRVDGIHKYAELLGELTALGFKELHQAGSEFSEPGRLQDEALENAFADARRRAEVLARASGRELGSVLRIEESGSPAMGPQLMARASAQEDASYSAGEQTLEARVEVRFRLD